MQTKRMRSDWALYAFTAAFALGGQFLAGSALKAFAANGWYDFSEKAKGEDLVGMMLGLTLAAQFVFILLSVIRSNAKNFSMFLAVAAFAVAAVQFLIGWFSLSCSLYGDCF